MLDFLDLGAPVSQKPNTFKFQFTNSAYSTGIWEVSSMLKSHNVYDNYSKFYTHVTLLASTSQKTVDLGI